MHSPDFQKKGLQENLLATIEEASEDEVAGLRRCVEAHKISGNNRTIEKMVSWVGSTRVFKRRATKSVNQDVRNMMNVRVN